MTSDAQRVGPALQVPAGDRRHAGERPVRIDGVEVDVYRVPTDAPESDGTLEWDSTTAIVVRVRAGGAQGIGYTYGAAATGQLIHDLLTDVIEGADAMSVTQAWVAMRRAVRNAGYPGVGAMAISAVDTALWDLKARLLDLPLATLLDQAHESIPVYGSGGFTSYSTERLAAQLGGWVSQGIPRVKMKVGRQPDRDLDRVRAARAAIGDAAELFVDANGAYSRKQALSFAEAFAEQDVRWFEEPVSSDDLEGLRFLRDRAPAGMEIAAGEYGYDVRYFRRMLDAQAVDVLQADATRGGITGFLQVAELCSAYGVALSSHTAPMLHLAPAAAAVPFRHLEYFHDHVRIERLLFDGAIAPHGGVLQPDRTRPGLGLELKRADSERYRV